MRKIVDENGRLFGKISVIDLFVILLVVVIGIALYVKYNVLDVTSTGAQTQPITYTVVINGVRDYTVNALKIGDKVYDKDSSGNSVGTITDISVADARAISEKADGTSVLGYVENCYDVTLTIQADGLVSGGRTLVNRTYELNANSQRVFITKFAAFTITITGISA